MTPAAEALLARVYGVRAVSVTPAAEKASTAASTPPIRHFNTDRGDRSLSPNWGIPRPCYDLAENRNLDNGEKPWRGN